MTFTDEEKRAIAALRRLAKKWPGSLRLVLVQQTGELYVAHTEDCRVDDLSRVPNEPLGVQRFKVDSYA